MIKVIKLKPILMIVGIIMVGVLLSIGIVSVVNVWEIPKVAYTIVIDAGHGGWADGCSGVNGGKESDINLSVARSLKNFLEEYGVDVVMTRLDRNALYDANATNFKESDMKNRVEIINKENPHMVISIHQNSFPDSSVKGAQAFYQEGNDESKVFAESVQSQLLSQLPNAKKESNAGDYYLLKESSYPAIIVECGYLTNDEEEKLLLSDDYQNKVAYSIMCGVVKYFGLAGND